MAQSKFNDLAGKFGKGGPPGLSIGLKLLAAVGATAYGINQSLYTGNFPKNIPKLYIRIRNVDITLNLSANFSFITEACFLFIKT